MLPRPSPEFEHMEYHSRWMLYRNAYKAVTAGALVLGVLFAWFTGPQLADRRWPNRYHAGVDRIVRDNGLPNGDGYQVEAWRQPNGRVRSWASPGVPDYDGQEFPWGLGYLAGLLAVLFFGGRHALLPYRQRLGVDRRHCVFFNLWSNGTPHLPRYGPEPGA